MNKTINQNQTDIKLNLTNIHFWPCIKNTKMDPTYENVGYTSTLDYHDFLVKEYFFKHTETELIKPQFIKNGVNQGSRENPPIIQFINLSNEDTQINITFNYQLLKETYDNYFKESGWTDEKSFNPLKINYFLSDFNGLNDKIPWSFWFVTDIKTKYKARVKENEVEIATITYALVLDEWSVFHNEIWNYSGVINVLRMHNQRWVEDNLFGTGGRIPDFASNQFIRNCDEICQNSTDKVQQTPTEPLISSRHWDFKNNKPLVTDEFLIWEDASKNNTKVKSKKLFVLFWLLAVDQAPDVPNNEMRYSYYQGEITDLDGYSVPMQLAVYIPSNNQGIPNQKEIQTIVNKLTNDGLPMKDENGSEIKNVKYRILGATITENLWADGTLSVMKTADGNDIPNLYHLDITNNDNNTYKYYSGLEIEDEETKEKQIQKEYFYFIDNGSNWSEDINGNKTLLKGSLYEKMFKKPSEIIQPKLFYNEKTGENNTDLEPHNFTNNHFETTIQLFNKNSITFDISTLLINNNANFDTIECHYNGLIDPNDKNSNESYTFKLLERKGTIAPDYQDVRYFLLDKDTSIAYKRDNNVMSLVIQGNYTWPIYDNTYNEMVRTGQNQRQAGLDNIQQQYKTGQSNWALGLGGSLLNGAVSGAAAGASMGGVVGAGIGAVGSTIGAGLGQVFGSIAKNQELKAQKDIASRSLNAKYNDAKNMQGNTIGGSPTTTQADLRYAKQPDDDYDERNYKNLWTPLITFKQIKPYDAFTISLRYNKLGYPQNRWLSIETLNDVMIRKFWNQLKIANADEFFKKNAIPNSYAFNLIKAFMNGDGIRFHNLQLLNYEDLFDYTINNYEKDLDEDLMILERAIYG